MNAVVDKFHAHLDECKQCREHPFALCRVGDGLLRSSVADVTGEQRANARKVAGIGGR